MKLLIRGGSLAAGHGVKESYVDIVTQSLSPNGIHVVNRSRFKDTSFEGIATFRDDLAVFKPDMVLLHFGVDDAFQYVYRSEFQENTVQMVRLARQTYNPRIFLATSHTFDHPEDMEAVYIFYRSLRIVAADLECVLIPVHSYWAGYLMEHHLNNSDLVQSDTRYPNERGHRVIAEVMTKYLIDTNG